MPPAYEVLLLNTAIPQIQAAQSGDTYVVPRDIAFSAALTLSAGTANGVPYLNGSKVVTTGSALTFDGTNLSNTRSVATAFSGTNPATWANGVVLTNSATPASGVASLVNFGGAGNVNSVFGVAQNAGGYGDFVWASFNGAFSERMRLDASGNLGLGETNPTAISSGFTTMHIKGSNGGGIRCGTTSQFYVYSDSTNAFLNQTSNGYMAFSTNNTERARITSGGDFLVGTTTTYGTLSVAGPIAPAATPSSKWGIDFASSSSVPNYASLAAAATYDLVTGSGVVVIHSDSTGDAAMFLTYAGVVTKLGGAASIVSGTGGVDEIGLAYNAGAGKYRINNGYATTQNIFITTIRTRTAT